MTCRCFSANLCNNDYASLNKMWTNLFNFLKFKFTFANLFAKKDISSFLKLDVFYAE